MDMRKTEKRIIDENGRKRIVYEENGKFYLKSTNKYKETRYTEIIFATRQTYNANIKAVAI